MTIGTYPGDLRALGLYLRKRRKQMARDDYFVIMYKILSYLYACMKAGKRPLQEDFCCECTMFSIPETYWNSILEDMVNGGYVKGVVAVESLGMHGIKVTPDAAITMEGVTFLQDNSKMQKVKEFLGKGFETVLAGIIAII